MAGNEKELGKVVERTVYVCTVCGAHFYTEQEAQNCLNHHNDNNLKVLFEKFEYCTPLPAFVWVKDIKTNEVDKYISEKEFLKQLYALRSFKIKC